MSKKLDYQQITEKLSDEQLKAVALLIKERKQKTNEEPLFKHKFNNFAQERFRNLKTRYRNHKAANKVGKTDENGFELVAMCKGKCEEFGINFPHKPPLKIWYCGRDRNVLSDEPLASIKRYLKGEGIDHRTVYTGQLVNIMYIWDDEGNQSEIRFKPYNGEIGIFESANVHAVFMDEEPPRDVFSAIKTKIGVLPGYVFLTMTPDKGMSWTYDLIKGSDPDHGNLASKGMLETIESSVFENMLNFKIMTGKQWIKFPVEYIDKIEKPGYEYKEEDGETYLLAPDTFAEYIDQFTFGSNEYRMRLLGHYVSFSGHVYPYDPTINTFDLEEMPPLSELKFFGAFDYGYSDEACFVLIGIDKSNTLYLIDGFYQSYMDAREQAKKIKEICDFWGVKPEMIVADNQIDNRLPQKDSQKAHIQSIYDYFLDELGSNWTVWRREELDKRDPHIKRDAIVRALKGGKIKFNNHQNKCIQFIQEMQRLEFKDGKANEVKGKDHFDAALRMFMGAGITYDHWRTSDDIKAIRQTHHKYRVKATGPVY
jgi:phage terminase large subunit-like protein